MGKLVITRDDRNNYSTSLNEAVCALLTNISEFLQKRGLPLGNLRSIR